MNPISNEISVSEEALAYARLPYRTEVRADERDGSPCVVARNPEFAGCMADGATTEEAVANLREVRAEFIQMLLDAGAHIPMPIPNVSVSPDTVGVQSINIFFPLFPEIMGAENKPQLERFSAEETSDLEVRPFFYRTNSDLVCGSSR